MRGLLFLDDDVRGEVSVSLVAEDVFVFAVFEWDGGLIDPLVVKVPLFGLPILETAEISTRS